MPIGRHGVERLGSIAAGRDDAMTRWLYSLLMWLAQPLLRLKLRHRARQEPGYAQHMAQRFGFYTRAEVAWGRPAAQAPVVWVHAVSLGETRAAGVLIERLRARIPDMRLLLSHGTDTGRQQGLALLRDGDLQVWQPWDSRAAVARFLANFRPAIGLLMETEVWPNLSAACARSGVPLCLVNARLSEKSLHKALRVAWLARPAYQALRAVWAQTEADAQRLRVLGAPVQEVLGNIKFDSGFDAAQWQRGQDLRRLLGRPVLMFASSREGEEDMLLQALRAWPVAQRRRVQWLLVPRHPQRFDEVANLFAAAGFSVARRSQWTDAMPAPADIWIGDSLGEMAFYFGMSDMALLGGSFARLGGQNLIEAAACACPVLMGPHTYNFSEAAQLALHAGAAFELGDISAALQLGLQLVDAPDRLQAARGAALNFANAHRGAALRTADAVCELLRSK
jgi:3-deoxy-D-manno-octulosonic-acid transferase